MSYLNCFGGICGMFSSCWNIINGFRIIEQEIENKLIHPEHLYSKIDDEYYLDLQNNCRVKLLFFNKLGDVI